MKKSTTVHHTFSVERSLKSKPAHVFKAFSEPVARRRWFYESNPHELLHYELDFKVGGAERSAMKFGPDSPIAGATVTSEKIYEVIVPDQRIVTVSKLSLDGKALSVSLVTVELTATEEGTDLVVTHQGTYLEGTYGPDLRKGDWEDLLAKLEQELAA